jgi:hypothetical protein
MGQFFLKNDDELTTQIIESGIVTWNDLVRSVQNFHYERNSNRFDLDLVWKERKGTCSSKHAFLKHISELNNIPNVKLILAFYKMDGQNTPGIGKVLEEHSLEFIPEAHCYLSINNEILDITKVNSDFASYSNAILGTREINPVDVIENKITWHRQFLQTWLEESNLQMTLDELWFIREKCIHALEK